MKRIYKYPISIINNSVNLPQDAEILHVDAQYGQLCLWALVDTDNPIQPRTILVIADGHQGVPKEYLTSTIIPRHLGTVLQGPYVLHIFEVDPK